MSGLTSEETAALLSYLHHDRALPPGLRTIAQKLEDTLIVPRPRVPKTAHERHLPSPVSLGFRTPNTAVPVTPTRRPSTFLATPTTRPDFTPLTFSGLVSSPFRLSPPVSTPISVHDRRLSRSVYLDKSVTPIYSLPATAPPCATGQITQSDPSVDLLPQLFTTVAPPII
ncbi:hypothetical protein FPV67DRAFT_1677745 [Lyophyllum atratum]|nr:hypothetical protein FPV67DRAFT_1677745 [Lyophyllum atratum]